MGNILSHTIHEVGINQCLLKCWSRAEGAPKACPGNSSGVGLLENCSRHRRQPRELGRYWVATPWKRYIHPYQAAIVGIDVLEMEGIVHNPNTRAEINGLMGNVKLHGQGDRDGAAVGAKYRIGVQDRLQDGAYRLGIGMRQHRIGGRHGTVAGDQHRDLFVRQPPIGLAALPCRPARALGAAGGGL